MDVLELSRKLEGDLLESKCEMLHTSNDDHSQKFSPRITRSKSGVKKLLNDAQNMAKFQSKGIGAENEDIENVYLNKRKQMVHKNLETIYETPVWKKGNTLLLGNCKVKRSLYLDREFRRISKVKSKLRKIKMKKLGKKLKLFKMTDDEFKHKMSKIENFLNETDSESDCVYNKCDIVTHMEVSDDKTDKTSILGMNHNETEEYKGTSIGINENQ